MREVKNSVFELYLFFVFGSWIFCFLILNKYWKLFIYKVGPIEKTPLLLLSLIVFVYTIKLLILIKGLCCTDNCFLSLYEDSYLENGFVQFLMCSTDTKSIWLLLKSEIVSIAFFLILSRHWIINQLFWITWNLRKQKCQSLKWLIMKKVSFLLCDSKS